jgi:hypothetical protein
VEFREAEAAGSASARAPVGNAISAKIRISENAVCNWERVIPFLPFLLWVVSMDRRAAKGSAETKTRRGFWRVHDTGLALSR